MPRRTILSEVEGEKLRALPNSQDELIRYYTLNELDLALIKQRRNDHNRLGFAVQLCYLRYPGYALPIGEDVSPSLDLLHKYYMLQWGIYLNTFHWGSCLNLSYKTKKCYHESGN